MRILFVNCVAKTDFTHSMPLAVPYLISYIKDKFNTQIHVKAISVEDLHSAEHIIKEFKPTILGLSTTTSGYEYGKQLAKRAKDIDKDIKVVVGGPHITLFPESVVKNIDYAVRGEGEETFYELLNHLYPQYSKSEVIHEPKDILGLIYWDNDELKINGLRPYMKDLDVIGHPDRRLLNPTNNTLFTSRGCPYNCVFCSSPIIWKRTFRMHSAQYIFEEIKTLYELKHSVQWFGDDLFIINKNRIKELIRLMKEAKLLGKISFFALGRSNLIDEEMAHLLKQLNVMAVSFGFETGDDTILKYAKKGQISVKDHMNASRLCRKNHILVDGYIMIGFQEDSNDTMARTYKFFKKYSDTSGPPNLVMVFPRTELNDDLIRDTGKDYSKIHHEKMNFTFGIGLPATEETIISKHLTPKDIEMWRKKFMDLARIKNKWYYGRILLKLIFSKGLFMNIQYLYQVTLTRFKNPKREFISETIRV